MTHVESHRSTAPTAEREWLLFPDCIEELMERRGNRQAREWLDGMIETYPRCGDTISFYYFGERGIANGDHPAELYGLYRLWEMGWTGSIERVHLPMNLAEAEADGDTEVVEMTRAFARQKGLQSRPFRPRR